MNGSLTETWSVNIRFYVICIKNILYTYDINFLNFLGISRLCGSSVSFFKFFANLKICLLHYCEKIPCKWTCVVSICATSGSTLPFVKSDIWALFKHFLCLLFCACIGHTFLFPCMSHTFLFAVEIFYNIL